MKRCLILLTALVLVLSTASLASAAELGIGARAIGMGGAYVAVADDGTAAYWNPAAITQIKLVGITPSFAGAGNWTELQLAIDDSTYPPQIGNNNLQLNGMVGAVFKGIGLSLLLDAETQTFQDASGSNGSAAADLAGMVTLAREFGEVFAVGVNLKGLGARRLVFDLPADPVINTPTYTQFEGYGYAMDLGAMFKVGKLVRLGAVVENWISNVSYERTDYSFDPPTQTWSGTPGAPMSEALPKMLHVGMAVKPPLFGTLIAVQVDQQIDSSGLGAIPPTYRLGVEQSLLVLKLRAGAVLADDFAAECYTAGVGLKLGPAVVDVAAEVDPNFAFEAVAVTAGFTF